MTGMPALVEANPFEVRTIYVLVHASGALVSIGAGGKRAAFASRERAEHVLEGLRASRHTDVYKTAKIAEILVPVGLIDQLDFEVVPPSAPSPGGSPEIRVDRDVPIPPVGQRGQTNTKSRYPWRQLGIGDSFYVPGVNLRAFHPQVAARSRADGRAYEIRAVPGGVRVWRVWTPTGQA